MKPLFSSRVGLVVAAAFFMSGWLSPARAGAAAAPEGAGQPEGAASPAAQYLPKPPIRPADWIVGHDPVNPNASPEARALLKYLYSISGKHTIIGQHNFAGVHELSTAVAARGLGKTPALYGTDWGFSKAGDIDSIYARSNTVQEVIKQWRNGSIIALCWHEVRPTADEPVTFQGSPTSVQGRLSDEDWEALLTPGTPVNKKWCAQVDVIAGYLRQLADARVPVLWRPLHEMNGNWFWWGGRVGERGTRQLYRMMYDRLVNVHKLNNLVWVWNCDRPNTPYGQFVDYFPGQQYVDVLGLDCYGAFEQRYYDEMNALSDGKVMAVSEGGPPALDVYKTQPKWAYYMPWASVGSPVFDSQTPAVAAAEPGGPARRGGGGGGRGGGVNLVEMARDPRMFCLEDAAYWESIQPLRAACGLPPERPAAAAPAPAGN
ncbi:MAG: glycosyl hydrolase [Verrucomicrobiota bacterium]